MLLVAGENVCDEGTLTREVTYCHVEGLGMPELTHPLATNWVLWIIQGGWGLLGSQLDKEA
jgi:hypothetical protein